MNTLSNIDNYFIPNTLDGINIIQENINDNALLLDGTNFMLADLDVGGFNIKNLDAGIANNEAVNVGQLNAKVANYVDLTSNQTIGGTKTFSNQVVLSNGATCNNKNIINVLNPVNGQDVATKNYVDNIDTTSRAYVDASLNLKVNRAGDTMTGSLNMGNNSVITTANPTTFDMLTRKGYVDTEINTFTAIKVSKSGDTMTGSLNMGSNSVTTTTNPTTFDMLTRKGYVDTEINNFAVSKVNKAGDTMTGNLDMGSNSVTTTTNPTTLNMLTRKGYVDTEINNVSVLKVNKAGDTMTGVLNLNEATNSRNIVIKPKQETYSTGGGGSGTRYNYVRFNFGQADGGGATGRQWCISAQNDAGVTDSNDLYIRCGSGGNDATRIIFGYQNINTYVPLIRNSWSSGEIIQTQIYNQTSNGSGIALIDKNSGAVTWKSVDFTMLNSVTDSILCVEVFAPFYLAGSSGDVILSQIRDYTGNVEQEVCISDTYYDGAGGGGGRGSPFLPLMCSYTPTNSTTNKIRKIEIRFNNASGDDQLFICKRRLSSTIATLYDADYYTIKITEYKK